MTVSCFSLTDLMPEWQYRDWRRFLMIADIIAKPVFYVIGKEGSTEDGKDFVKSLWKDAEEHFDEVKESAVKKEGKPAALWGIMSDPSHSYRPWEDNYSRGLYLAGVECTEDAEKEGWVKWKVPGAEYIRVRCEDSYPFREGLDYLKDHGFTLAGAVYDCTDLQTGVSYICYPVRRLPADEKVSD